MSKLVAAFLVEECGNKAHQIWTWADHFTNNPWAKETEGSV